MNSVEALRNICYECERHMAISKIRCPFRSISNEFCEEYDLIKNDLEILECFRKIPKQDLKDFIEWQIRYEKNMNTWLEGCNADLSKEEPTKHLIKIKEWLEE